MLLGTREMKQISNMSSLSVVKANFPSASTFSLLRRWWPLVSVTIMFTWNIETYQSSINVIAVLHKIIAYCCL